MVLVARRRREIKERSIVGANGRGGGQFDCRESPAGSPRDKREGRGLLKGFTI